jgi:hypothetical protein
VILMQGGRGMATVGNPIREVERERPGAPRWTPAPAEKVPRVPPRRAPAPSPDKEKVPPRSGR